MSLPTEIIDYILSFLRSDPVALKTCVQSHPTLCKLAERYIYADISLHDDPHSTFLIASEALKTSEFALILTKKPEIATHVRSLKVYLRYDTGDPEQFRVSSDLDTIASILPLLSGLTKIELKGNHCLFDGVVSWPTVPETFRQAFLHLLHIQGLKYVSIFGVAFFPLSLLNTCKNISVMLSSCQDIQYEVTEDLSYGVIEHLSVQYCCKMSMKNITDWVQVRGLRSLMFQGNIPNPENPGLHLQQLLAACSNLLRVLEVDIFQDELEIMFADLFGTDITDVPFTLANLLHLERFTLVYPGLSLYGIRPSVTAIMDLINTASPTLKRVSLRLELEFETLPSFEDIWAPFIPLAAKCSSLSITVYIFARMKVATMSELSSPSDIFASIAGCTGLMSYVEKGVFVILPL